MGMGFGSTWLWQKPNRGGQVLVRSWFEPGKGFGSTRLGQSQTGVVRSWFEPGQVLVRSWFGLGFDMVMTKAKPGWSGPGQVLVRTWFGFWFEPGLGFGSTRL